MKKLFFLLVLFPITYSVFAQPFPDSYTGGKYYSVNSVKIYAVTVGKGAPLFIIPGGPGSSHIGYRVMDSLALNSGLQVIYFDGFGRGKSDTAKTPAAYSLHRDIEDLEGLRKAMGLDKISLYGHSYGSLVAQGYALKYRQHTRHLVIANGFHSFLMWQENDDNSNREIETNYPEVWDTLMKVREQGIVSSDPLHQEIYGRVPYGFLYAYNPTNFLRRRTQPYPNVFNTALYYQMVGRDGDFIVGSDIGNFDFRKDLKNLKMPVLIIAGRYDRVAVPRMQMKYKDYCPQAKFVMFEKSGHNPQVEEQEATFKLVKDFLKN